MLYFNNHNSYIAIMITLLHILSSQLYGNSTKHYTAVVITFPSRHRLQRSDISRGLYGRLTSHSPHFLAFSTSSIPLSVPLHIQAVSLTPSRPRRMCLPILISVFIFFHRWILFSVCRYIYRISDKVIK